MGENQPSDVAELRAEVMRLRQALWEVIVAVDELACVVDTAILTELPAKALADWVAAGGLLVRFAGPLFAAHPDALLPVHLLAGERALGGALTWGRPEHLAAFPPGSPFAGLAVPGARPPRRVPTAPAGASARCCRGWRDRSARRAAPAHL